MIKKIIKPILKVVCKCLFRVQVNGVLERQYEKTLIIANHESFLDGLLLGLFLPIDATFVVHTEVLKKRLFRWVLSLVNYYAVDPTSPLAIKSIIRLVESGRPVVIFPEGRITVTGSLMKIYDGAAFVAAKTGATIVPIRLQGAAKTYFSRMAGVAPRQWFPKISLTILPVTAIAMPDLPTAKQRRRQAGEKLREIMQTMLVLTQPIKTLYEAFLDAAGSFGRSYRLVEDVRQVEETYGTMIRMSVGVQRLLRPLTKEDEAVGILTPNAAPTLGLILGLTAMGRVPAMLNYTAGSDGLQAACTAAKISSIITSRAFIQKAKLETVLARLTGIQLYYLEDLKASVTLLDKLAILKNSLFPKLALSQTNPDKPAVILFTSGSEGKPKGVVHSHRTILTNVAQIRAVSDFMPTDKFMIALPLFHSFGLTAGAMLPLVAGCRAFLYPSPLHYRIIPEIIYDRGCTVMFGTSTFLGGYAKFAHPYDFGRLRYVVAGAEKLSDMVRQTWIEKFGIRILEGYGVTECAPVVAVNTPMSCRLGSVGQALPCVQTYLEPVPGIEEGGLLHVKGPNIMQGYLKFEQPGQLQAPESSQGDGWYNTGDIVRIDGDGFIHIQGRMKRFAKLAGEMVSLEVVEKIAIQASPINTHAASTRDDANKGEAIVLFTTDKNLTREQLSSQAKLLGNSELCVPRDIRFVESIPLLGTGKTDYVTLKNMAAL